MLFGYLERLFVYLHQFDIYRGLERVRTKTLFTSCRGHVAIGVTVGVKSCLLPWTEFGLSANNAAQVQIFSLINSIGNKI